MNISSLPKISIVTPVFNAARFIEDSINSVINQNYPNWEYIIIDGGSTDGTVEIIERYDHYISYWETKPDRGQTHALNKGFKRATGILRGWLNADEEYLPGTLKYVGEAYHRNNKPDLIYGDRYVLNLTVFPPLQVEHRIPPFPPFAFSLYTGRHLYTDATFWTKELHDGTGELDEKSYPRYAMDAEWLLRLTGQARRWQHLGIPLSIYKHHGNNVSAIGMQTGVRLGVKIIRNYAARNKISRVRLFSGWLWYLTRLRIWSEGIGGLLKPPQWSTFADLFLSSDRSPAAGKMDHS